MAIWATLLLVFLIKSIKHYGYIERIGVPTFSYILLRVKAVEPAVFWELFSWLALEIDVLQLVSVPLALPFPRHAFAQDKSALFPFSP